MIQKSQEEAKIIHRELKSPNGILSYKLERLISWYNQYYR